MKTSEKQSEPYLAAVSRLRHDLLTSVNHLVGYAEILLEELEDQKDEELASQFQAIQVSAKDALFMIQTALASGTIETALTTLRLVLPGSISAILDFVDGAAAHLTPSGRDRFGGFLERVRSAALKLQSMAESARIEEVAQPAASVVVKDAPPPSARPASLKDVFILVVDDNERNRELLCHRLERDGYRTAQAEGGRKALDVLLNREADAASRVSLVLLDVMMPDVDGFEVLQQLQSAGRLSELPVIIMSAADDLEAAVRCIELGAEDYLPKPCNPVVLRARIDAALERQRLRGHERIHTEQLKAALAEVEEQKRVSESLLANILPARISKELQENGQVAPKYFEDVTIAFTDFVGFSLATEQMPAEELVEQLHDYFTAFDGIVKRYGLEKLKTIGDSYMFMGGLTRSPSHPVDVALACMEILYTVEGRRRANPHAWNIRIGMHTGPVIAGVVGIDKFAFDVWGETVNTSSRMESAGEAGRINVSDRALSRIKDFFEVENRGEIPTKERPVRMFFLKCPREQLMRDVSLSPPPQFARRYRTYFERELPSFPSWLAGNESNG